ncbi:MAG: hypothetical protein CMJ87_13220 [Planctomycetes bacterium]|jgi:hypothetical protein|nr:hypothetical protein [Planctomycetota bacterium]
MPEWLRVMLSRPGEPATPLSRYTVANGFLYIVMGLTFFAAPALMVFLPDVDPFQGVEEGLVRVLGFTITIIGWFYIFGGRTNADSFGLATVGDRLLVPLFLVPLAITGQIPVSLAAAFSVLDPVLGIGAYVVWRRQRAATP